ncbi:AAA family ATPase [Actinoplanes sp. NPDC051851]|uniref:MinD/ParA family ATP-binding protein n=1 Tax=Actinoplanes sp. NPDC051851 TaxID=3154753 RepID=UPI00342A59D4
MDGTETGWGRPAEPTPRWRALLDRARHGGRSEEPAEEPQQEQAAPAQQQWGQTTPPGRGSAQVGGRPVNPLEQRNGYETPRRAPDPQQGFEAQRPMPQRPVNPLDPRWQNREQPATYFDPPARGPQPAAPPPPPARNGYPPAPPGPAYPPAPAQPVQPPQPNGYYAPQAYASPPGAPPQQPPVRPVSPPAQAPPPATAVPRAVPAVPPAAPSGARIEWRQTHVDDGMERAVSVMRRKLGQPRVLAFANPKGGVHKTTATVLAAATIGSVRGRGVLAWDDNELRGTLGLRAGSARHARTIKHLLADLLRIENLHGDALLQELDAYLRHASDGSYDVLAGEENPRFAQRLDQGTVRRVMDLLRRTHDVICVDTGNNVESVNWQTVMRMADQLVITTVPREDAAFTADWMLDVLDESGMGDMVANAVTLISCPSPGHLPLLEDFKKHFATRTRAVAVVPYDPALEVGSSIEYADLQPETRQAWLRAASVMLEPFAE